MRVGFRDELSMSLVLKQMIYLFFLQVEQSRRIDTLNK